MENGRFLRPLRRQALSPVNAGRHSAKIAGYPAFRQVFPMSALAPAIDRPNIDETYTLEHKYTRTEGRIYLSGVQALVRLPLMQQMRDRAAGANTAGFISGYRGSPLGGFDLELWKAKKHLKASNIEFQPGLNEDLGATMVWGTQQANLFPGAKYDGVFAMWYGKGPGVDRCGDVFKHGNAAGTSKFGGVLALAADDHACRSSTLPHGSELEFVSAMMPVLNPAGVQDILDMGLLGWAMSRFTGRWVGFKTIAETVESSASVNVNPHQLDIVLPEDFALPAGGLNIRWPDPPLNQEMRLHQYAVQASQAFARANRIDKIVLDSPKARLGIVTTGKSYLDVLQALEYLGISAEMARDIGIRVYKVGMTWPLEPVGIRDFARGLEDVIVVEEKRSFIESQMKEYMFNWDARPHIVGKYDEDGNWILPSTNELTPAMIALVIAKRHRVSSPATRSPRASWIEAKEKELTLPRANFRAPRTTVRAARTTPRRTCRKARARSAASAATTWSRGWIAAPTPSRRWAAKARRGAGRRRSPKPNTCSRTSATAPTSIPARWRSARRSPRRSTSPTRSSTTTRSR
jgi:indolepyruvate ferredoxin oxidoreductase